MVHFGFRVLCSEQQGLLQEEQYLGEDSVLAAGIQGRVVSVLHSQASVNVEAWHEVGLARLRVLQTLGNESRAPLGQQQELLDMLPMGKFKMSEVPSAQNITYFLLKPLHCQVFSLPSSSAFHTQPGSPRQHLFHLIYCL